MKTVLLAVVFASFSSSAFAQNSNLVSKSVAALLVRNATTVKLVDTDGKVLPSNQQLPALIADSLTTGYEDAAKKGSKFIALAQVTTECKATAANAQDCTVYFITTNFDVAKDGYELTKLDDASGAWVLDVKLKKQSGKWELANKKITAFYAD